MAEIIICDPVQNHFRRIGFVRHRRRREVFFAGFAIIFLFSPLSLCPLARLDCVLVLTKRAWSFWFKSKKSWRLIFGSIFVWFWAHIGFELADGYRTFKKVSKRRLNNGNDSTDWTRRRPARRVVGTEE